MKISANSLCPCHSQKKYKKCCKIYHEGILPPSAKELMRSRYAAFALNNASYIIKTTHPQNSDYSDDIASWEASIIEFSKGTSFNGLQILDFEGEGTKAYVSFHAILVQNGQDCSFKEKSLFYKVNNQWLYHSGIFFDA